ncbi:MAG: universal stress protein [Pseudomonadota bacterium]
MLAATDFSPSAGHAVRRAALLASELNASLRLLHVSNTATMPACDEERLQEAIAHIQPVAATPEIRTGEVTESLLAAADHADMLVLGVYGNRPIKDALLGTTADRLLRKSRRPMLVVKQPPIAPYRRVLVALDFSLQALATLEFAHQIAPGAATFIFHAYDCPDREELRLAKVTEPEINRIHVAHRDRAFSNLENIRSKVTAPTAEATFVVLPGDPKELVSETAGKYKVDLVVVGKHGRSRIEDIFLGGVARRTLATAHCDVAVVPGWPRI